MGEGEEGGHVNCREFSQTNGNVMASTINRAKLFKAALEEQALGSSHPKSKFKPQIRNKFLGKFKLLNPRMSSSFKGSDSAFV